MTNLNSVTYLSLHHTHLLVAHVLLIIKLYTNIKQKIFFSSSPPQVPRIETPFIPDFSYISLFLIVIGFLTLLQLKLYSVYDKKFTKFEIKHIQR